MNQTFKLMFLMLCLVLAVSGQNTPTMQEALSLSNEDAMQAKSLGLESFKILPRGMFDYEKNELSLRGGGAYYSFHTKSQSYNETPQIELQQGKFFVGFNGINYGFIADLGVTPLSQISRESESLKFLLGYQPPKEKEAASSEKERASKGFELDGIKYSRIAPAVVGHTYLLRAITYTEADTLVAFHVYRKEADGSLIIFWKPIEQFDLPLFPSSVIPSTAAASLVTRDKVLRALRNNGFTDVEVDASTTPMTLRGTVPKGKLAEAMRAAQEAVGKPFVNQIIEK